jgi:beta-phosphoglucomutase-like phosphatase (HAD superfamily)
MYAVLLDFNGTMFFDTSLHMEAWSKIYQELYPDDPAPLDTRRVCGATNVDVLKDTAPWLTDEQCRWYSVHKEALYRQACLDSPEKLHLAHMAEPFLDELQGRGIPFALASASIMDNIEFYFDVFGLGRWFQKENVVYDDGTYPNKGAMHLEAARRLNGDIRDCLLIEDSPHAIELAAENGAGCIVAIGDTASPAQLKRLGAHHYIRDFSEFDPAWLDHDR